MLAKNPKALIGVHCLYGLNRTGYMICRYLIEMKGWAPKDAIDAFEDARGETMKNTGKYKICIDDLKNRKYSMEDWLSTEVALGGLFATPEFDLETVFPALDPLQSGLDGADGGAAPAGRRCK